jgi:hypothetical protein
MIEEMPILFTEWVHWRERARLVTPDPHIGVYAWAHFHEQPGTDARPYPDLPSQLIYVGETKNLNYRPLGPGSHVGLERYAETYPSDHRLNQLYVSVFRVKCVTEGDELCRVLRAFTRYVEDLMYWKYVQAFEKRPALDYARKPGYTLLVPECCSNRS